MPGRLLKTPESKVARRRRKSKYYLDVEYRLFEQPKTTQIVIAPSSIGEHSPQRAYRKCIAQSMICHHNAPAVGAAVDAMTSAHTLKGEAIGLQGANELTSRDTARSTGHTLTTTAGSGNSMVP